VPSTITVAPATGFSETEWNRRPDTVVPGAAAGIAEAMTNDVANAQRLMARANFRKHMNPPAKKRSQQQLNASASDLTRWVKPAIAE
jgi:hypothetical protein